MTGGGASEDSGPRAGNDFSGDADAVVQAGTVHGGVHVHGARSLRFPPPRQLPGGTASFINREQGLTRLDALLGDLPGGSPPGRPPAMVITAIAGAPGIGKTALALHWAHRVRDRFPDGDLFIDMRGYGSEPPLTEEQALDSFLRSLSIVPDLIPEDLAERAALYRSLVADKKMLVVIDNVASASRVRHLLPGSRHSLVLITTRGSLSSLVAREGATRVTLDVLSPADAVDLLAGIVGEERVEHDQEAAAGIAGLCGYLPLALRIVAERMAGRPHASLGEIAEELTSEQRRLDALASADDPLTDVRAVFSWSYQALPADQQRLFRTIGLHAGAELSSSVAAAMVGRSVTATDAQLQQLARVHLVQETAPHRFRSHDLLRAYSAERGQLEDPQRERTYTVRRMLTWYLLAADNARRAILPYSQSLALSAPPELAVPDFPAVPAAMSWYEQERLNILAALQQAMDLGQFDLAWKLPAVADGFFELRSYWTEWRQAHTEALTAATTIGDSLGEASARRCLGDVCWRNRDYDAARDHYERAADLARGIRDPWLEGFAVRGSGLVRQDTGHPGPARALFEQARAIFEEAGLARGAAMSVLSLSRSARAEGSLQEAADLGEQAIAIFREISDRWSMAWGLIPLGGIYAELSRPQAAQAHLAEAAAIFRDFGDRRSEALVLAQLGAACLAGGDRSQAADCWTRALTVFEELGDPSADDVRDRLGRLSGEAGP